MTEIWKEVIGTDGAYEVSNLGNVRSYYKMVSMGKPKGVYWIIDKSTHKLLRPNLGKIGYFFVSISTFMPGSKKRTRKVCGVHRLVLEAFNPSKDSQLDCAHLDGDKTNNHISNLIWATRKENLSHKKIHGTQPMGSKSWNARFTEDQVREIRSAGPSRDVTLILSRKFGVSRRLISQIRRGNTWKHVS